MTTEKLYSYANSNEQLIEQLALQPHPEGGHFAVTHVTKHAVPSPFVPDGGDRAVQSTIYYLLSMNNDVEDNGKQGGEAIRGHRSAVGYMHRNRSETMHLHHSGRVVYTLISTNSKPPRVRQVVMGEDLGKGEVIQLMVGDDEWKVSEIPSQDREWASQHDARPAFVGGLISEVVTPGFDWQDHEYITMAKLEALFEGDKQSIARFSKYVLP